MYFVEIYIRFFFVCKIFCTCLIVCTLYIGRENRGKKSFLAKYILDVNQEK